MPTIKYYDPTTLAWEEVSTAGAQGPPGPQGATGATGPAGQGGGVSVEAGNIARDGVPDGLVFVPDQVVVGPVAPVDTTPLWVDEGATGAVAEFLPLTGGTLTGPLTLAADPAGVLEAAPKQYVDARIWFGTQVAYDAIVTKDPTVLYVVSG